MNRIWQFLGRKQNRTILGWVGSGLVVLTSGLWAVAVYLFPADNEQKSKASEVKATCGGIAVGGSVTGSAISAGATEGSDCSSKVK